MKKNILAFCMLLLLFISTSFAAEETTLFEHKYSRTSGAPNVYTDTFLASPGKGMLIVKNGFLDGGKRKVDAIRSASIFVNGIKIFGPRNFKKQVHHSKKRVHHFKKQVHLLEKPVNLLEENTISIKLAGRPGSYLTLEVIGEAVNNSLPTTKGGRLEVDETWSGEVAITGDVIVPQGVTLTIAPDTVVRFLASEDEQAGGNDDSLCELIIEGSLVADQVTFTSSNTSDPTTGDWYGIVVQPSSGLASVNLSGCIVEYAKAGINAVAPGQNVSLTVTDSEVRHSSLDGIYIDAHSGSLITLDINNTRITDNGGLGMYCHVQDDKSQLNGGITDSTIADNNGHGLYVFLENYATSDLDIISNTIYGNLSFGIYTKILNSGSNESRFNINNNTVYNSGTGIHCYAISGRIKANITENEVYKGTDGIYCYAFWESTFSALITGNTIHDNSGRGIYCNSYVQGYGFSPEIRNNQIYNNTGNGIYCNIQRDDYDKLDPVITENNVYGNGSDGIYCEASEPVEVLNNDIHDNSGRGLYLNAGGDSYVNYNNLYNSGSYDLENGSSYDINGEHNFWGTSTTTDEFNGSIYDYNDDPDIGTVYYEYWVIDKYL